MKNMTIPISWCFLLYFAILFTERVQSLARVCLGKNTHFFSFSFEGMVNLLAAASLAATVIWLTGSWNSGFWRSLVNAKAEVNYTMLCITAGIMLISGMVHTEFTVPPIQFTSYAMLILAMILKTAAVQGQTQRPLLLWLSLAYLTAFSMAIPVMYRTELSNAPLFYVIQAVVTLSLIAAFTVMLCMIFQNKGENLFLLLPILIAAIGDAAVLAMRWKEKVNTFVLIFVILSAVLFAVGKISAAALR